MKEIDLLPEWYKSSRRRQMSYRTQCAALGCLLAAMVLWNLIAGQLISKAAAEVDQTAAKAAAAEATLREFAAAEGHLRELEERADILDEIDSKIDVASVLGEISFLVDEKIVLNKVRFDSERFAEKATAGAGSIRWAAGAKRGKKQGAFLGDVRFKVLISGVAAHAGDVAELICKLEDSPYFCLVGLAFSRNVEIKAGTTLAEDRAETSVGGLGESQGGIWKAQKEYQVTEFEISCYIANYR